MIRPPTRKAVVVGVQRSLGTGVGVTLAVGLAGLAGQTQVVVVLLFLVTTFMMMSLKDVNYALSASLAAGMVVFLQRLVQGDTSATAVDRFAATVIGVVIAFAVLGIVQVIGRQRRAAG